MDWAIVGPWSGWGAFVTLAFLVLRAVVKGDLVPRSTHERETGRADHDASEWRTEGRIKDQAILTELEKIAATSEQGFASLHAVIAALQKLTGVGPRTKGDEP